MTQFNPNLMEEKRAELAKDWRRFSHEFEKLHDLASFQFSDRAVEIFNEYERKKIEERQSEDVFDWIDGDLAAPKVCLEDLKRDARRDLKIK